MLSDEKIIEKLVKKVKDGDLELEEVPPLYIDRVRKALEEE